MALLGIKSAGIEYAEILASDDSCELCKALARGKYPVDQALRDRLLPNKFCTNEFGCRCTYIAVIE